MFVKIEGSYINLALVHSIDLNDDGTATLWFAGADGACRDVTADDLKIIEATIRHDVTKNDKVYVGEVETVATVTEVLK